MQLKISEVIHKFLKYKENIESFSPLSLKAYKTDLKQAFDNKQDSILNYSELWQRLRPTLMQWGQLSLASRNRKIATLKSFFSWLYEQRLIEINYSNQLICPKVPKKIPNFLSVDEAIALLDHLNKSVTNQLEPRKLLSTQLQKVLFLLLYGGGLRISEACKLKWKDIDFSSKRILITGKGDKERYSILPDFCFDYLKKHHSRQSNQGEFVLGQKPMNPRTAYELIRNLGSAAGLLNPLHPHSLRHSYATHLLADGMNLRILQNLLGHESLQATEKYTHLSVDHLARLINRTHPLKKMKLTS